MNQKRSWPGVPKRYSTRRLPMVIRPKSIATVVVVFLSTPLRSSRPALALVRASSVHSGRTSLTAPTNVVLPAPNPPATRILNAASGRSGVSSEGAESMQYLLKQVSAGLFAGGPPWHHGHAALLDEIGHEDPDHTDRQRHVRRHISHGDLPPAQAQDPAVLRTEAE